MVEYITDDGSPHVRATGSTISNAARRAFVELITRHDLQDITIKGVNDLGGNPAGPSRVVQIEYTDHPHSKTTEADVDPQPKTLRADASPLTDDGTRATPGDDVTRWEVTLEDTFNHD